MASRLAEAAERLRAAWSPALFDRVAQQIPAEWLSDAVGFPDPEAHRAAYAHWLTARLAALPLFVAEAERARAELV